MPFLGWERQNTKIGLPPKWVRVIYGIFSLKEFWCVWTRRNFYIEISGPVEYSTSVFLESPHTWKAQKKSIFRLFLKCDLDGFRYRFLVQNNSKTPPGPISGHISSFRPISATLSKFEFLAKIDFLANFGIFDFSKYDLPFGRKWPEIWLVAGNCLFGPPKHFYITYMIFYDH